MKVDAYDEFMAGWKVPGGTPGSRVVNKLRRANYQFIVLPFITLATGVVTQPAEVPEDVIYSTRLADCLAVLNQ